MFLDLISDLVFSLSSSRLITYFILIVNELVVLPLLQE